MDNTGCGHASQFPNSWKNVPKTSEHHVRQVRQLQNPDEALKQEYDIQKIILSA